MPGKFSFAVVRRYPRISGPAALPLFCLAPHGVFRASRIASRAVSSCLAFSPLPVLFSKNRRYVFCDTLRQRSLWRTLPAFSTRHAAVWCSDFPLANPAHAEPTSDHLPSPDNLAEKLKSGSRLGIRKAGTVGAGNFCWFARTECAPHHFLISRLPDSKWWRHGEEEN